MKSPFVDDQKFALVYMAKFTREEDLEENADIIESLFYDKIYDIIKTSSITDFKIQPALEILINIMESK